MSFIDGSVVAGLYLDKYSFYNTCMRLFVCWFYEKKNTGLPIAVTVIRVLRSLKEVHIVNYYQYCIFTTIKSTIT